MVAQGLGRARVVLRHSHSPRWVSGRGRSNRHTAHTRRADPARGQPNATPMQVRPAKSLAHIHLRAGRQSSRADSSRLARRPPPDACGDWLLDLRISAAQLLSMRLRRRARPPVCCAWPLPSLPSRASGSASWGQRREQRHGSAGAAHDAVHGRPSGAERRHRHATLFAVGHLQHVLIVRANARVGVRTQMGTSVGCLSLHGHECITTAHGVRSAVDGIAAAMPRRVTAVGRVGGEGGGDRLRAASSSAHG